MGIVLVIKSKTIAIIDYGHSPSHKVQDYRHHRLYMGIVLVIKSKIIAIIDYGHSPSHKVQDYRHHRLWA
jgi:hypothetical protein